MKENQNDEKTCPKCRYYSQHYSKQGTRYETVFCGHCLNISNKNRNKNPVKVCELWEDISIKKDERKKSIKETLIFMSERLNEITMILKDDVER